MFENYDPMDRHQLTLHCLITLQSPMSHIGESIGNQSNLKTIKVTDLEGNASNVFCYSGNALRNGVLRRKGVDSFLDALGIDVSPTVHQTLFAGGFIDGGTGNDLDLDKKIRQLIPPLSVLGTAKPKGLFNSKDAQMLHGRLAVGDAQLVCYESAEYLFHGFRPALPYSAIAPLEEVIAAKEKAQQARIDEWLLGGTGAEEAQKEYEEKLQYWLPFLLDKLRANTEWFAYNQKTRRDSLHQSDLHKHLALPTEQKNLLEGEAKKKDKSQQMIMGDWLIQQGAQLYSRWDAYLTDIEEGFLADALLRFNQSPYLGGKSGTGCGLVSLQFWYESGEDKGEWMQLSSSAEVLRDRALEQHSRYKEYLAQYREYLSEASEGDEIKKLLS